MPNTCCSSADLGEIEFRNLTFKYHPSEEPVLSGINLKIPAGYTVAFVAGQVVASQR